MTRRPDQFSRIRFYQRTPPFRPTTSILEPVQPMKITRREALLQVGATVTAAMAAPLDFSRLATVPQIFQRAGYRTAMFGK